MKRVAMAVRTVRLDDDSERILSELTEETEMTISAVLKEGLLALRNRRAESPPRTAYELYEELDLGPGGYAIESSTESRRGVREATPPEALAVILVDTGPLVALSIPRTASTGAAGKPSEVSASLCSPRSRS